jgi:hypothetical protein
MQARGFQIIQALRTMNLVDRFGYLQFDEDDAFDEQVNRLFPIDRRLTLSSPVSICVFCVVCGSTFLAYCRHEVSNSLTATVQQTRGSPAFGHDTGVKTFGPWYQSTRST